LGLFGTGGGLNAARISHLRLSTQQTVFFGVCAGQELLAIDDAASIACLTPNCQAFLSSFAASRTFRGKMLYGSRLGTI
jgi:hypothetical protein